MKQNLTIKNEYKKTIYKDYYKNKNIVNNMINCVHSLLNDVREKNNGTISQKDLKKFDKARESLVDVKFFLEILHNHNLGHCPVEIHEKEVQEELASLTSIDSNGDICKGKEKYI